MGVLVFGFGVDPSAGTPSMPGHAGPCYHACSEAPGCLIGRDVLERLTTIGGGGSPTPGGVHPSCGWGARPSCGWGLTLRTCGWVHPLCRARLWLGV